MFNKLVGAAVQSGLLNTMPYRSVVEREFGALTAENDMKMATIARNRGAFNFSPGDAIVDFGNARGMPIKGHTLLWHGSVPPWVDALPPSELRPFVEDYVRSVVTYFRGRVRAWDVVNEAVNDGGQGLRDTVFRRGLGDGYIAEAFRIAREADPSALLFYNDYGGEGLGGKADRIYDLVRNLRAAGVPIDGVGLQMHISASSRPSDASIAANMRRLADLGLLVNISEMDVRIASTPGTDQDRLEAQKSTYYSVVRLCVAEPRCDGVTFWGFTDAHTWLAPDRPLLFDAAYQPKPAYFGVLQALGGS
jgi:endo-1,4-beta-xylanase